MSNSNVLPVLNNNNFIPIRSTIPNPLDMKLQAESYNLDMIQKLTGLCKPTVAGTYNIIDIMNGSPLIIPENSFVIACGIQNVGTATSGGTNATIQTNGTPVIVFLNAVALADLNKGFIAAPVTAATGSETAGVVCLTTGTFAANTTFLVNVFFVHLE